MRFISRPHKMRLPCLKSSAFSVEPLSSNGHTIKRSFAWIIFNCAVTSFTSRFCAIKHGPYTREENTHTTPCFWSESDNNLVLTTSGINTYTKFQILACAFVVYFNIILIDMMKDDNLSQHIKLVNAENLITVAHASNPIPVGSWFSQEVEYHYNVCV